MPRSPSLSVSGAALGAPFDTRDGAHDIKRSLFARNARRGELSRAARLFGEARWLAFAALALYLFLILVTYSAGDPGWSHSAAVASLGNRGGRFGAWLADVLLSVFGYSAYWLIVLFASRVAIGYRALVRSRLLPHDDAPAEPVWIHLAGFAVMLIALVRHRVPPRCRGRIGATACRRAPGGVDRQRGGPRARRGVRHDRRDARAARAVRRRLLAVHRLVVAARSRNGSGGASRASVLLFKRKREARRGPRASAPRPPSCARRRSCRNASRIVEAPPIRIEPQVVAVPQSARVAKEKQVPLFAEIPETDLPPLSLLAPPPVMQETVSPETLEFTSRLIEKKLKDFGVEVQVVAAHPGPIITRYEIEPATGVKGSQIVGLAKDLARALSLVSIRVVETIPGKTTMGLELPNPRRQAVRLSEILGSQVYNESPSPLTLALGKDIAGRPVVADLAKMPHLLVAGTTGSGKSVGINAMILSLLYKAEANQVRLILIDPKMLELSVYEGIAHLLAPVVTDMRQAGHALNWAVAEMERRYKLMSQARRAQPRRLQQQDRRGRQEATRRSRNPFSLTPDAPEPLDKLPTIVIVIDELADLMMVVGKKVEELIARIAQKARAAGIHLILATQRPSRRRHHRPHQGQHPDPHRLPGLVEDRLPHDPRPAGRRGAARDGRHAVPAAGHRPAAARARRVRRRRGSARGRRAPEEAGGAQGGPNYIEGILEGGTLGDARGRRAPRRAERRRRRGGRAVRRGGRHRAEGPPRVDLVRAAQAADRLQPRGAAARGHGEGRPRVGAAVERQSRDPGAVVERRVVRPRRRVTSRCNPGVTATRSRALLLHRTHRNASMTDPASVLARHRRTVRRLHARARPRRADRPVGVARRGARRPASFASQTKTAKGQFTQRVKSRTKKPSQPTSGDFVFARPGKFRWTYTKPYEQLLVADGQKLSIYDKDLNQVTVSKLGDALGSSPAAILFGSNDLDRNFDLKDTGERDGIAWLEATPKSQGHATSRRSRSAFATASSPRWSCAMRSARTTLLEFSNVERNPKVDPSTFVFMPPKGADVVKN